MTTLIQLIKIELCPEEIELFKSFRKVQDDFQIMLRSGVFDFKNGDYIIRRDGQGKLRKIIPNVAIYEK